MRMKKALAIALGAIFLMGVAATPAMAKKHHKKHHDKKHKSENEAQAEKNK